VKLAALFGGLWRDREFRIFWSAQTVSEFGDRVTELALPLIAVTLLEASPAQVGLLTAAVWAPNLISLFIGTWVEQRRNKRGLMIAADLFRLVVLLSLPLAYWMGALDLWQLYAIALLAGAAHVVFNTAYAAFFVRLVKPADYMEANSKLSGTRSLSFMAGPAVGGILIQAITAPLAIVVDALSFVVSALQIGRLRVTEAEPERAEEPLLQRAFGGLRYVFSHPYLSASLGCATTVNFFNLMGSALLVLFASRYLGLSAGLIGIALGIGASGGLLGAVLATRLARAIGVGRLIATATVVFPASMAVVAFADGPMWVKAVELGVAEFVGAFSVMCFDIPLGALQASVTDDNLRSRVSGAFLSINFGVRPFGAIVGGLLGDWIGPRDTLLVSAVGGAVAVLWLLRSPILKVRTIEALQVERAEPGGAGGDAPSA
jgi:predicted MFS family arabinose efflux permease